MDKISTNYLNNQYLNTKVACYNAELKHGERYYNMQAPAMFWDDVKCFPDRIKECCNGVGSNIGWLGNLTFHFIPNTIWFLNVTEASDIHDWMYVYPNKFATRAEAMQWKDFADDLLLTNLVTIIERDSSCAVLRILRKSRAMKYNMAVSEVGSESFMDGKIITSGE